MTKLKEFFGKATQRFQNCLNPKLFIASILEIGFEAKVKSECSAQIFGQRS